MTFQAESNGIPVLVVSQPALGIKAWKLRFPDEKVPADFTAYHDLLFNEPMKKLPLGTWVFDDLMYLPGTVVINLFDHGIQLLPKAATIDGKQMAWQPELTLDLRSTNKFPFKPQKPKR